MAHNKINTAQIEISALETSIKKAANDLSKIDLFMQKYEVTSNMDWIELALRYISRSLDSLIPLEKIGYKFPKYGNHFFKLKLEIEAINTSLQILYNDKSLSSIHI
jgi:hypothetical protein